MQKYFKQTSPFVVPTTDGKLIEEHFGIPSTNTAEYSIAHMIAPAGWSEPFQTPAFDEITYIFKGKKIIEIDDEKILLEAGQSILIIKGCKVRYSNPFDTPVEYISVCLPAFSPTLVNRKNE